MSTPKAEGGITKLRPDEASYKVPPFEGVTGVAFGLAKPDLAVVKVIFLPVTLAETAISAFICF